MISKCLTSMSLSKDEPGRDEFPVLGGLALEAHEHQGVEGVDRRHQQRVAVPVAGLARERPELVVPPGVSPVAVPGVQELGLHPAAAAGSPGGDRPRRRRHPP